MNSIPRDFGLRHKIPLDTIPEQVSLAPAPSNPTPDFQGKDIGAEARANAQSRASLRQAPVSPAAAPVAPPSAPLAARPTGALYGAGKKIGGVARSVAGPAALAAPLAGFGDYKIDEPGVDSSAMGTVRSLASGDFAGAAAGLRKGAVETSLDSVSGIAKTVDGVAGLVGLKPNLAGRFEDKVHSDISNLLPRPEAATSSPATTSTAAGVPVANPVAPVAAPTDVEQSNARMGLRAADQRGSLNLSDAERPIQVANALGGQGTFNLGTYDGNATIYGRADNGVRVNNFTGTGEGSSGYENTSQYKDGVARAQGEKTQLARIEAKKAADEYADRGKRLMVDMENSSGLRRRAAKAEIDQRTASEKAQAEAGLRGQASQVAQQRLIFDMQKEQRDNAESLRRFNAEQKTSADKNDFTQTEAAKAGRISADNALYKESAQLYPDIDGKADPRAAQRTQGHLNAVNILTEQLKANPTPENQRLAEALAIQGTSALGADTRGQIDTGIKVMARFSEQKDKYFGGAKGSVSTNPLDFVPISVDPKDPTKVILSGGQVMDKEDLAYENIPSRFFNLGSGNDSSDLVRGLRSPAK